MLPRRPGLRARGLPIPAGPGAGAHRRLARAGHKCHAEPAHVQSCPRPSPGTTSPPSWWQVAGGTWHDRDQSAAFAWSEPPRDPAWTYPHTLWLETLGILDNSSRGGGRRRGESFGASSNGPHLLPWNFSASLPAPLSARRPCRASRCPGAGHRFLEPRGSGGVLC